MGTHHIVRSFDEELSYLEKGIIEMGRHAQTMLARAVRAVISADQDLAAETIAQDAFLDKSERNLGEKAVMIIARRQPMAVDLREIIGTIRIAADWERIGDMAKNIAKRSMGVAQSKELPHFYRSLESISSLALEQQNLVLEIYTERCLERISEVQKQDEKIDSMYTSIFRELLTYMMEDSSKITACTNLLFCAKNIERMGDHATNIAETLYYVGTGSYMSGARIAPEQAYSSFAEEMRAADIIDADTKGWDEDLQEEVIINPKAKTVKKPKK